MILGPTSLLDCVIFVVCLVPNLLITAGPVATISLVKVIPFLVFKLPYQFVWERYLLKKERKTPFVQRATVFEDIIIRCVRYAFANIPAHISRVFFQKWVVYPFFRFRLLRHGYLTCPVEYHEINRSDVKGIWISDDRPEELEKPDLVVYYCHGGGFSMGSSYFYLEFLISWLTLLKEKGFQYPAIFALEYTLVPDETWPKQFEQMKAGYNFLNSYVEDSSKICLSGDSAGATLVLSRLLHNGHAEEPATIHENEKPGIALLLSPWTHLVSEELNRNTPSDYLDSTSLHVYARQYAGNGSVSNPVMSPGLSEGRWNAASPEKGYHIIYGAEEVFALGIEETVRAMKRGGAAIETTREDGGIHAWPVVNLFLADEMQKRLKGLERMSQVLWLKMRPSPP